MATINDAYRYLCDLEARGNPHAMGMPEMMEPFVTVAINPTDRALRYRANATPPIGPKQCCLCGSRKSIEVGHVNGREEDNSPENLFWTCRSCNVLSGNTMRNAGIGRKTRQYNPRGEGARSMAQWVTAVAAMKGESDDMSVEDAVDMIRHTSQEKRSQYAGEIWSRRKRRYGRSGREEVPF